MPAPKTKETDYLRGTERSCRATVPTAFTVIAVALFLTCVNVTLLEFLFPAFTACVIIGQEGLQFPQNTSYLLF